MSKCVHTVTLAACDVVYESKLSPLFNCWQVMRLIDSNRYSSHR